MASPEEVVRDFCAMWAQPGGGDAAIDTYFTPETIWENHGMAITTGPDEAKALNAGLVAQFGIVAIRFEQLAVAATGNTVMTERIDHMLDAEGKTLGGFPLMGIFEVEGDKILVWRDYFDSAGAFQFG